MILDTEPTFKAIADHALLVSFADEIYEPAHASVIALDKAIAASPPEGFIETVPALVNLSRYQHIFNQLTSPP